MIRRYRAPALSALGGAVVVALLLGAAGWPGPVAWQVSHVALGGWLGGAWTWTQHRGVMPAGVLVDWWPPVMGASIVVVPVLAHLGGTLAVVASTLACAVASLSVWVARDCIDRLEGLHRRRAIAPPGPERQQMSERLDRVHSEITEQIRLLDLSSSPDVGRYLEGHRSRRREAEAHG